MRKSKLNLVNLLKERLIEFPKIVNSLEKKEPFFVEKLLLWIKNCEELFTTHNLAEASELAGFRGKIVAHNFSAARGMSARKAQTKIGAEILYEVQRTVLDVLRPIDLKMEESRELIVQLLLLVSSTGEIKNAGKKPFEKLINEVWQFILANDQLRAGAIKLKTTLPVTDIQMLLAQEINLEDF